MNRMIPVLAAIALVAVPVRALADGDVARGEQKFGDCAACHSVETGVNNVGPSLHAVFGRRAGDLVDFRYSPALKRSGITWTAQTLDEFIADPQKIVPANRMPYGGEASGVGRARPTAAPAQPTEE